MTPNYDAGHKLQDLNDAYIPASSKVKALIQQHELNRLLKNLGIGLYPTRPRSPPPPSLGQELEESQFSDCESQVPTDWDDWEAA